MSNLELIPKDIQGESREFKREPYARLQEGRIDSSSEPPTRQHVRGRE